MDFEPPDERWQSGPPPEPQGGLSPPPGTEPGSSLSRRPPSPPSWLPRPPVPGVDIWGHWAAPQALGPVKVPPGPPDPWPNLSPCPCVAVRDSLSQGPHGAHRTPSASPSSGPGGCCPHPQGRLGELPKWPSGAASTLREMALHSGPGVLLCPLQGTATPGSHERVSAAGVGGPGQVTAEQFGAFCSLS